jgi:hypothetical protein
MPRKSAAALSIVAKTRIDGRQKPPAGLTAAQRRLWERVTATEPADLFATEATRQLLADYCKHVTALDYFSAQVDGHIALAELPEEKRPADARLLSIKEMDSLLIMRARETKAVIDVARQLRLTNRSRYTDQRAATAGKRMAEGNLAGDGTKPWHVAS